MVPGNLCRFREKFLCSLDLFVKIFENIFLTRGLFYLFVEKCISSSKFLDLFVEKSVPSPRSLDLFVFNFGSPRNFDLFGVFFHCLAGNYDVFLEQMGCAASKSHTNTRAKIFINTSSKMLTNPFYISSIHYEHTQLILAINSHQKSSKT